jgi:UDP-glucose-4-epimerase GalE
VRRRRIGDVYDVSRSRPIKTASEQGVLPVRYHFRAWREPGRRKLAFQFMNARQRTAVLVTGGAGYIGSHTAKMLHEAGYLPVIYDNLSSGYRQAAQWGEFVHGDIRDGALLGETLEAYGIRSVIHFAGLIEVGRSGARPDLFWEHNVAGTATLLATMRRHQVSRLVFSSSAAVYGHSEMDPLQPIREDTLKAPASAYGDTKLAAEWMIAAQCRAYGLTAVALRYFNAAGADPSGRIGEAHEPETHLLPLTIAAALGNGKPLTVFGTDFETPDGTCLRDYVHVNDLADAHIAALRVALSPGGFHAVNIGAGEGCSVLQVMQAVERATGHAVPHVLGARREGDPASLVAEPSAAWALLGWRARRSSLDQIVRDALRWECDPAYGSGRRAPPTTPSNAGTQSRFAPAVAPSVGVPMAAE